jgi:hypothetical protein
MEDEKKPAQPVIDEYKGKPVLRIPLVDEPNPPSPSTAGSGGQVLKHRGIGSRSGRTRRKGL